MSKKSSNSTKASSSPSPSLSSSAALISDQQETVSSLTKKGVTSDAKSALKSKTTEINGNEENTTKTTTATTGSTTGTTVKSKDSSVTDALKNERVEKNAANTTIEPINLQKFDSKYHSQGFFLVLALSFATRFYLLSEPHYVIFDEVHFGKFASQYLQRTYFFDVHPPLGKLLLALVGYLSGNDGSYLFQTLGADYLVDNVPYLPLRVFCASMGALIAPSAYITLRAFNYSVVTATLAGLLIIFDNALLTQSRYILLDSMLLFFTIGAFMSLSKFIALRERPFSKEWIFWLASTGAFLGLALGVKYVGLFIIGIVGLYTIYDLWSLLGDLTQPLDIFAKHFLFRAVLLIVLPLAIYTSAFAVHFAVLNKTGPGDSFMSLAFQASLEGNPIQTLTKNHPREIAYGSYVTIKSTSHSCYLHSHVAKYPLTYPDGRISSGQQQVTCYPHKDVNNWWKVLRAEDPITAVYTTPVYVQHGDNIKFVHVTTNTTLNTHDVASTITATLQEVSAYNAATDTVPGYPNFYLDTGYNSAVSTLLGLSNPKRWNPLLEFKLRHEHTGCTLQTLGQPLPEWGFSQYEVTSTLHPSSGYFWIVEEIEKSTIPPQSNISAHRQSFFMRLVELHLAMFAANARLTDEHAYQSRPADWPLLKRGISFWQGDSRQVYLIGNPIVWWVGSGAIVLFVIIDAILTLREKRGINDLPTVTRYRFSTIGRLLVMAWALHYFPFFVMGRQLFLHHYLPALMFKIILIAVTFEHVVELFSVIVPQVIRLISGSTPSPTSYTTIFVNGFWAAAVVLLGVAVQYFLFLSPLSYGTFQKGSDAEKMKIRSSWDVMINGGTKGVV